MRSNNVAKSLDLRRELWKSEGFRYNIRRRIYVKVLAHCITCSRQSWSMRFTSRPSHMVDLDCYGLGNSFGNFFLESLCTEGGQKTRSVILTCPHGREYGFFAGSPTGGFMDDAERFVYECMQVLIQLEEGMAAGFTEVVLKNSKTGEARVIVLPPFSLSRDSTQAS